MSGCTSNGTAWVRPGRSVDHGTYSNISAAARIQFFPLPPNGPVFTRRSMRRLPLTSIRVRNLPCGLHVVRLSPNHSESRHGGGRVPTTSEAGRYYVDIVDIERSHRSPRSCEDLKFPTSQGRLELRHRPSYAHQGMFHALLQRSVPCSHIARTRR